MRKLWTSARNLVAMWAAEPSRGPAGEVSGSAFDFEFSGIDGTPLKLDTFRGKALLIVNTASFCGYTKQYAGLQELWTRYAPRGLVVIGVPSNDFGAQEPGSEGEIREFCQRSFAVTFPMTAKQHVIGPARHPFYAWAADVISPGAVPRWNFHKYLVGRDGGLLRSFSTKVPPDSPELEAWIGKALAGPADIQD